MKKLLGLAVLGLLLTGCGGTSSLLGAVTGNPYDGTYKGSFSDATLAGNAQFTIVTGSLSGTVTDTASGKNYPITAAIDNSGNLSNGVISTTNPINFSGTVSLNGAQFSATLPESGGAAGTLTLSTVRQ